jgi:hypothetical protein
VTFKEHHAIVSALLPLLVVRHTMWDIGFLTDTVKKTVLDGLEALRALVPDDFVEMEHHIVTTALKFRCTSIYDPASAPGGIVSCALPKSHDGVRHRNGTHEWG